MLPYVTIPKQEFEIGLKPAEADTLAIELAKMEVAQREPRMGEPSFDEVYADRRKWLEVAMPAHVVEVGPFEIDVFPVTNLKWEGYARAYNAAWAAREGPHSHFVTGVSWNEAMAFAQQYGADLPTEEEWECAARVDRRLFTWGDAYFPQGEVAFTPPVLETYEAGSRPQTASLSGIHDLLGQFGEYTKSEFRPYPGADVAAFEKLYPAWRGMRVQRGGYDTRQDATCVSRRGVPENERRTHMKFRLVRRL